jgi:hypothetical protein
LLSDRFVPGRRFKVGLIHAGLFALLAVSALAARASLGESRAQMVIHGVNTIIPKMFVACTVGPLTGLKALILRPLDALLHGTPSGYAVGVLAALLVFLGLRVIAGNTPSDRRSKDDGKLQLWWTLLAGVIAWSICYLLAFRDNYYPPTVAVGRLTGIHNIAGFGAALATGALFALVFGFNSLGLSWLAAVGYGAMASFGYHIQTSEYAAEWEEQRTFWFRVHDLIQDFRPNDVVVFQAGQDRFHVNPWTVGFGFWSLSSTQEAFSAFFRLPEGRDPGKLSFCAVGYYTRIIQSGQTLLVQTYPWDSGNFTPVMNDHLILLQARGVQIVRLAGPVKLNGFPIVARAATQPPEERIKFTRLFWKLFGQEDSRHWFTLQDWKS